MLLRALFWIGAVAVMMPHEPDLGLGRPNMAANLLAANGASIGETGKSETGAGEIAAPQDSSLHCSGYARACAAGLSLLDNFQAVAVRSLEQVKAEIENDQRHARHTTDG